MSHGWKVVDASLGRLEFTSAKEVLGALRICPLRIASIIPTLVARATLVVVIVIFV